MTDFVARSVETSPPVPGILRPRRQVVLAATVLVAGACATALAAAGGPGAEGAASDDHLALLLRFMAVLKALTAVGAAGLVHWRFRAPITTPVTFGYCAALVPMTVAPGLIWSLDHVALGALVFHAGLFGGLVVALGDDTFAAGRRAGAHRAPRPRR